jgi:putative transposase
MSRFNRLAHAIWYCHYHIVWVPKYRFKVLEGEIKDQVEESIRLEASKLKCVIVEMNIQRDHVHIVIMIPPKISLSDAIGTLKGKSAIRVLTKNPKLRQNRYWGNHFWARGYCVDTVGINLEMIVKYVRYQDKKELARAIKG